LNMNKGTVEITVIQHSERSTNYHLAIFDMGNPDNLEGLRFSAQYLVVMLSPSRTSHFFQGMEHGFLHWSYVSEKLDLPETDARIVARLIGKVIQRPTD